MKILIVEDDDRLAGVIRRGLSEAGHVVDLERDGVAGETAAATGRYEAIILDIMLPGKNGLEMTRALRGAGLTTPILLLTARDEVADIIAGLDAGADDYLRKPFVFAELEARLRSITRRDGTPRPHEELRCADLVMDLSTRRTSLSGKNISLTARETAFLEYLMRNQDVLVTRAMLEDALWERDRETTSNLIEVYVRRLRSKLQSGGAPTFIHTVRGAGYRFGLETSDISG